MDSLTEYVQDKFFLKKCTRYVQVDLKEEKQACASLVKTDCVCGKSLEWHQQHGLASGGVVNEELLSIREIRKRVKMSHSSHESLDDKLAEEVADSVFSTPEEEPPLRERAWTANADTAIYPCDTFGEIEFKAGDNVGPKTIAHGATAKYIRLQGILLDESYNEAVYRLMTKMWRVPKPQLIIEVTGSAQDLPHVDKKVVLTFNHGLIQAARNANAWLVTGGTNCGVMSLVGEAVTRFHMSHSSDQKITCLGIASWGIVEDRETLVEPDPEKLTQKRKYVVNRGRSGGYSPLDPGHNYFLLVDNGREKRFGEEIEFRAQFTSYLTSKGLNCGGCKAGSSVDYSTPLVLLVIGGGRNTLATVEVCVGGDLRSKSVKISSSLKQQEDMKRPVVILPGFGGAADLLASAYHIYEKAEKATLEDGDDDSGNRSRATSSSAESIDAQIRKHSALERLLGAKKNDPVAVEQTVASVKRCLRDRTLITVVNIFDVSVCGSILDKAILNAIFKSKMHDPKQLLKLFHLAQMWNQDEIAALILQKGSAANQILSEFIGHESMARAIQLGQSDFYELLMEYNVIALENYFSREEMLNYYSNIFISKNVRASRGCVCLFKNLLVTSSAEELDEKSAKFSRKYLARRVGTTLANILGCALSNLINDGLRAPGMRSIFGRPSSSSQVRRTPHHRRSSVAPTESSPYLMTTNYPTRLRDLFLFSLLLKRSKFATVLWRDSTEHLCTALMGSIFLKQLGKKASRMDMHDLAEDYKKLAETWRQRTLDMLTRCYDEKPEQTLKMLTRALSLWQMKTPIEVAYYGDEKDFIAHSAVQAKLNQVWHGRIATFIPDYLIYMIALVPVVCWPFAVCLQFIPKANSSTLNVFRKGVSGQQERPAKFLMGDVEKGKEQQRVQLLANSTNNNASDDSDNDDEFMGRGSISNEVTAVEPFFLYFFRRNKLPKNAIPISRALVFIYSAPMVKFAIHSLANLLFLLLFTFFILSSFAEPVGLVEVIIWLWSFCLFMQEVHSHYTRETISFRQLSTSFFRDTSGVICCVAIGLMFLSVILRCALPQEAYVYPHTTYALACLVYWMDSLRGFYVIEALGPKVIALFKMFQDLLFFLGIYTILLFAFAVAIHALVHPGQKIESLDRFFVILRELIYERYWNLLGVGIERAEVEVDVAEQLLNGTTTDELHQFNNRSMSENDNTSDTATIGPSFLGLTAVGHMLFHNETSGKQSNKVAVILYIIYLFLTNIMLLNMLIAMLSLKVEEVQSDSRRLWRFSYYRVVTTCYNKILLPAPLNIIHIIYDFVQFFTRKIDPMHGQKVDTELKVHLDPSGPEYMKLDLIEQSVMMQVYSEEQHRDDEKRSKQFSNDFE